MVLEYERNNVGIYNIVRIRQIFATEDVDEWLGCFVVATERKVRVVPRLSSQEKSRSSRSLFPRQLEKDWLQRKNYILLSGIWTGRANIFVSTSPSLIIVT